MIRWYFKSLRRIDAEKQLMSDANEHGSFLVSQLSKVMEFRSIDSVHLDSR